MNLFGACVYVGLALATIVLLTGLALLVFGRKTRAASGSTAQLELSIFSSKVSMPYNVNLIICGLGVLLLYLVFDLSKGGAPQERGALSIFGSVYAQGQTAPSTSIPEGWVYFGPERSPQDWNFKIIGGSLADLRSEKLKPGLRLKSLGKVSIREGHFGSLTGTWLGTFSPAPRILGVLPQGSCVRPERVVSVGMSKIWVKFQPSSCAS